MSRTSLLGRSGPSIGRRELLGGVLGGTAASLLSPFARAAGGPTAPKLVVVFADGAWDTTYGIDPKLGVASIAGPEVHEDPNNPEDRESVQTFSGIPVMVNDFKRPSVARFFEQAGADSVVMNGIAMGTIGHDVAKVRMVTAGNPRTALPDLAVIAGATHGLGLPLGSIDMSGLSRAGFLAATTGRIGLSNQLRLLVDRTAFLPASNGFEGLVQWSAETEDANRVAETLRARGERLRVGRDADAESRARFDAWGESFDRATRLKEEGVDVLSQLEVGDEPSTARSVGIAVDLLEGGLCHAVFTATPRTWDTHTGSTIQHTSYEDLFSALTTLHGSLRDRGMLESTLVLVLSEFTRTPLYNDEGGKDHWPNGSALMFGGGLSGGRVLGGSSDLLEALPVDYETGALDDGGIPCSYENFVAGMLELLDVDPAEWLPGVAPFRGAMG